MWSDVVRNLDKDWRVVAPDFQGYGRSKLHDRTVSHVRDIEALVDALRLERALIVGVSLGARVAAEFAARAPQRFSGLVLASPVLPEIRWSARTRGLREREARAAGRGDIAVAIDSVVRLWADGVGRQAASRRVRALVRRMQEHAYRLPDVAEQPPSAESLTKQLRDAGIPTLVVIGRYDVPEVRAAARSLARTLGIDPIVMNTAHLPQLERPHLFSNIVKRFLRDSVRPRGTSSSELARPHPH